MKNRFTALLITLLLNLTLVFNNSATAQSQVLSADAPFYPKLSVQAIKNEVAVTWTIINNDRMEYFVLQRSADGLDFQNLTSFAEATEEEGKVKYAFVDNKPLQKKNYYRVKFVDVDGKASFTSINYAGSFEVSFALEMYPNPSTDPEVRVKVVGGDGNVPLNVSIYELTGKCVESYSFDNYDSYESYVSLTNLDRLKAGLYVVIGSAGYDTFRTTLARK